MKSTSLIMIAAGSLLCLVAGGMAIATSAGAQSQHALQKCSSGSGFLAVSPFFDEDQTIFMPGRSVWRTTDGDATWQAVFELPSGHWPGITRIAPIRSAEGLHVYFGYSEGTDPYPPYYFTHSSDDGETWEDPWPDQLTGVCQREGVTNELGVLFSSCSTLWPLQGDPSIDGIHRSVDHGRTWERVWIGGGGVWNAIPSPDYTNDHTVFAIRLDIYPDANPYPMVSTDSGGSWHDLSFGLCPIQSNANINNLIVSPNFADDRTLFGITRNAHLLRSEDRGLIWQDIYPRNVPTCEQSWDFIQEVALSPDYASDQTIFMQTTSGFYVSYDDGQRWQRLLEDRYLSYIQVRRRPTPGLRFNYLPLVPRNPSTPTPARYNVYLPLLGGHSDIPHSVPLTLFAYHSLTGYNYRSDDGGLTWRCLNLPLP